MVLGVCGALALLILVALPDPLAGAAAMGVGAVLLFVLAVGAMLARIVAQTPDGGPLRLDDGRLDPVWATLALIVLLVIVVGDVALPDGKAIVLVGGITAIGSWLAYRRRLDDRRRSVAVALSAEIRVNAEVTYLSLAPEVLASLGAKPEGFKPFAVPVPPDYPVYVGNQDALGLLPPGVVAFVVRFYEVDESMTQAYNALGMAAFHGLERDRQNQLYAYIGERMEADYLPTTRRALEGLASVLGESPELPDFLLDVPRRPAGPTR